MVASLAGLLLALQSPPAEIDLRVEAWFARVSGSMKFDEKPAVGDRVDLEDDLGVGSGFMPDLRARLTLGSDRFSVGAVRLLWTSEETLDRTRRWNESLFPAGEEVDSRIDLFEGDLAYERRFAIANGFDLWAGVAARYLRLEAVLESPTQGRDDDHLVSFAPAARLTAEWALAPAVRIETEIEATSFSSGDFEIRGAAGTVSAAWSVSPSFALRAGWRMENLRMTKDISLEKNDFRARIDGLVFGAELAW
ncbi:MAG TPA: hypothetical protein VFC86_07345 [Planctomycetota bacterium]|nr:hypothetical protein [Planctomycetota bacterium]